MRITGLNKDGHDQTAQGCMEGTRVSVRCGRTHAVGAPSWSRREPTLIGSDG